MEADRTRAFSLDSADRARAASLPNGRVDFVRDLIPRAFAANLIAAGLVYLFLAVVLPPDNASEEDVVLEQLVFGAYVLIAILIGFLVGKRTFAPVAAWLADEREPTATELTSILRQPLRQASWVLCGWVFGAIAFAAIHMVPNAFHYAPRYGVFIGAFGILGGLAAAMLSYLLIEQSLRPVFARAFNAGPPARSRTLGIKQRIVVAWALGSAVVLVALALTPIVSRELAASIWFLTSVGLVAGAVMVSLVARSVATPITGMRDALAEVEKGNLAVRVDVDDASEVGVLQAGFNRMVAGLEEREALRAVFGTYVDPDVAQHILEKGTSLTGEEVDVTVMFVDVKDFTTLAERATANEVVATMNRLFEVIVPIVHAHGGHVDKFVGDGLLAVFGAPRRSEDHAVLAARAALEIEAAVENALKGELRVGIGINSGPVVSGNVGGGGRLEFSVIGDAVNVAARIETATRSTGDPILISESTQALLDAGEFELVERTGLTLKGKSEPVCLYALRSRSGR